MSFSRSPWLGEPRSRLSTPDSVRDTFEVAELHLRPMTEAEFDEYLPQPTSPWAPRARMRRLRTRRAVRRGPCRAWRSAARDSGFRDSGSAFEEQGLDAVHFYTRTKTVAIRS